MSIIQNMRFIILLTILLMTAICSCRSAKQTVKQTADSTSVAVSEVKASISTEGVLSSLASSTDIDLAGITVEFYPPDTAHPDVRASPKSLKIESAKARNETAAARQEARTAVDTDSINATLKQATAQTKTTRTDADMLHPSDWVVIFALLGAIAILFTILIIRHKNGTL